LFITVEMPKVLLVIMNLRFVIAINYITFNSNPRLNVVVWQFPLLLCVQKALKHSLPYYLIERRTVILALSIEHLACSFPYLTSSMGYNPSSETNSFSASQEISHSLCSTVVHDRVHNSPPLVSILREIDLPHALASYFIKVHVVYFFLLLGIKIVFFLQFSQQNSILNSFIPCVPYALPIIQVIILYEFFVVTAIRHVRHVHTVVFLQDRPPGGAAQPAQVHAAAPVAMVETVAEGEAYVERHAHRG
jgi:hypothetical protein